MKPFAIPVFKTAPFIRLLVPFILGIILQWYLQITLPYILQAALCFTVATILFYFLPISLRYTLQFLQGLLLNLLLVAFGLLITWQKDVRHKNNWYGHFYKKSSCLIATLAEPPIEKAKSFKADATVQIIINGDTAMACNGKLLLYFIKDSASSELHYGDKILINKNLQDIKNSGNPGAFNYKQYAAFQQIFHNVFLKQKDWLLLPTKNINPFYKFIFSSREKILSILKHTINESKDELSIAEALLIGYTNDLDKDLVQAYSNTGVVHIIAISGMHLGLIYIMLVWLFAKIPYIKKSKALQVILILSCLWLFSLLTGAAASILRSAVMFTFITIGKNFFTKSSIYNFLALSAFVLLCYNPYFLWDVGFQLSYLAIVGIIIFQKPIYNLFYIKNKWVNKIWQLIAVALAAQILTFPICIYYFHQFPNLFLITNVILVPLSEYILFAEIALIAFWWIPFVGLGLGKICGWLVLIMNKIILYVNSISFSVYDKIWANILSTWLMYAIVLGLCTWLINKNKKILQVSLCSLLAFTMLQAYVQWQFKNQQKIIVYNVPQHQAIDFIRGNDYKFIGDSILLQEAMLQNFHLKPTRIALQLYSKTDTMPCYYAFPPFYQLSNKRILIIDKPINFIPMPQKIVVDIIIISKNPTLHMAQLASVFNCPQYIADASNSLWKIDRWKKDCTALHLQLHSVPESGAFVINL